MKIHESWKRALSNEFGKPYFRDLSAFVTSEYLSTAVYPPPKRMFSAFDETPFDRVKVVILGQDPYHGAGQANGLSFSVNEGVRKPPSLQNIFKELEDDLGIAAPVSGNLSGWAAQGVLLLNATLTVRAGIAGSHQGKGWEEFTDAVVRELNNQREHLVFVLWGAYAQKKGAHIHEAKHLVLRSPHPSPFSAYTGFFGSKPFSKTNTYLVSQGIEPVKWA